MWGLRSLDRCEILQYFETTLQSHLSTSKNILITEEKGFQKRLNKKLCAALNIKCHFYPSNFYSLYHRMQKIVSKFPQETLYSADWTSVYRMKKRTD